MQNKKICIIGLGLIGGSLAKAFSRSGFKNIIAVDMKKINIEKAVKDNVILYGYSSMNNKTFGSDVIFICTPVKHSFDYIKLLSGKVRNDCIVTDVCSTKGEVINFINKLANPPLFVGGHPMAGMEKAGYESGIAHLFENAYYILTPCKTTTQSSINFMRSLLEKIGAIPVVLDADEHDSITGSISHVPHIIAASLVNMVKELDSPDGKMQMLAAGGFRDITRIASSNPEMWENIISSNKKHIMNILNKYNETINQIYSSLEKDDSKKIHHFLESARKYRNSLSYDKRGLIVPSYELVVDVVDKPGIIGEIASILGNYGINIKNINVSNSREFEEGCLRITLPGPESIEKAYDLLVKKGYKVSKTS